MSKLQDNLWIWMSRDDAAIQGQALRPILNRLEHSFLPKPAMVQATGGRESKVNAWVDPMLIKILDRRKLGTSVRGDGLKAEFPQDKRTVIALYFRVPGPDGPVPDQIRTLFRDLVQLFSPRYARCHLLTLGKELNDTHYRDRTFFASGMYWLNFFGPEEEAAQGGAGLAQNPYARSERLPQGLLLEVGEGPLDATTPEGERRLLQATAAMPPMPAGAASAKTETAPAMVETTVAGQRGHWNPLDQGFWVTRHLARGSKLDPKGLAALKVLKDSNSPPISQVHVLFSDSEAARANKVVLEAAGIKSWFVSPETGMPEQS